MTRIPVGFLVAFVVLMNVLAYHYQWHTTGPLGYCQGYGC